ncbi:MAG TPA: dihydrofolate reductase family protein [Acidimicrobiales bacterium]|nr:dihydrofolate reductase family protein [Acidimicrobiales bacterium]
MTGVTFMTSISLDGYFEGVDHGLDWQLVDGELHTHFNRWLRDTKAFLQGRVTWELMAGFWPTADEDPEAPPEIREFAPIWRDKPKYVFSRTLPKAGWNTAIMRDVERAQIAALIEDHGGEVVVGGPALAGSFAALDLIDEYRFYVHPVVLGEGHRPFDGPPISGLVLAETRTFGSGVVLLRYTRPKR